MPRPALGCSESPGSSDVVLVVEQAVEELADDLGGAVRGRGRATRLNPSSLTPQAAHHEARSAATRATTERLIRFCRESDARDVPATA